MFHQKVERCHWTAIESGLTSRGIPDSHYCLEGASGSFEYKKCAHWRVSMRPEQVGWIERQLRSGGRVFIAVKRADDEVWLLHGRAARHIKVDGLRTLPKHSIFGMWKRQEIPWRAVRRLLWSKF